MRSYAYRSRIVAPTVTVKRAKGSVTIPVALVLALLVLVYLGLYYILMHH